MRKRRNILKPIVSRPQSHALRAEHFVRLSPLRKAGRKGLEQITTRRWEYIRRNPEYRSDFATFKERFGDIFKKHGALWVPRLLLDWEAHPHRPTSDFPMATWIEAVKPIFDGLTRKWQLAYLADPEFGALGPCKPWDPQTLWAIGNPVLLGTASGWAYRPPAAPASTDRVMQVRLDRTESEIMWTFGKAITRFQKELRSAGVRMDRSRRGEAKKPRRKYVWRLAMPQQRDFLELRIRGIGPKHVLLEQIHEHIQKALRAHGRRPIYRKLQKKRGDIWRNDLKVWDLMYTGMSALQALKSTDKKGFAERRKQLAGRKNGDSDKSKERLSREEYDRHVDKSSDPWLQKIADSRSRAQHLIDGEFRTIS